jgi:hypothetical protein
VVLSDLSDAKTLEAMACREGLALAADIVLWRVRLASDSSNVIRSITEQGLGCYGQVIREIRARADSLREVQFIHERRSANVDAHTLARGSIYSDLGRNVWFISPLDGVCMKYDVI